VFANTIYAEDFIPIVRQAGHIVMEVYKRNWSIEFKEDGSPLTEADIASDTYLRDQLSTIFKLPILTEETPSPFEVRRYWKDFFLIDPLDGTKDFIEKNDEFAILVAYIKNAKPAAAVIYAPALEETYFANINGGAFKIDVNGYKSKLPLTQKSESKMLCSRHHHSTLADKFAIDNQIADKIHIGSGLKFGRLAAGEASVYPRFEGSKEWDIAAGDLIVREAGGELIDLVTLQNPEYNKPDLKNNCFVATRQGVSIKDLYIEGTNP